MNDFLFWWPVLCTIVAGAVGYGDLRARVTADKEIAAERVALIRADIAKLDEKLDKLTDYLLSSQRKA